VTLELDETRLFERELTFDGTGPCERKYLDVELPSAIADIVD
jgi:hypothetical protein